MAAAMAANQFSENLLAGRSASWPARLPAGLPGPKNELFKEGQTNPRDHQIRIIREISCILML